MTKAKPPLPLLGRRSLLGLHIAIISALLTFAFAALAGVFSDDPDGALFTTLFWMGGICAVFVPLGMVLQIAISYGIWRPPWGDGR